MLKPLQFLTSVITRDLYGAISHIVYDFKKGKGKSMERGCRNYGKNTSELSPEQVIYTIHVTCSLLYKIILVCAS
jgi:hypothetical protein